jgi:4-alpha-glucanotransferase
MRRQGSLGAEARRFVDFLQTSGFTIWQVLPLGPTHADHSPYQCLSVHAGSIDLISLDDLAASGWLDAAAIPDGLDEAALCDCLVLARHGFQQNATPEEKSGYAAFMDEHQCWLQDYSTYQVARQSFNSMSWLEWPADLRDRRDAALSRFREQNSELIEQVCFEQYVFFMQWQSLRRYASKQGVLLFGDMPIFVAHDSADVWAHRELFSTDETGALEVVAGVPPDYFSETGQLWGNPLYRWDRVQSNDFSWWIERFKTQLALFDVIRLDHFRGFEKYWEIPAAAETAVEGRWVEGPGAALFERLQQVFGELPLVAEDLGVITPEVDALRQRFGLPGMKILQFAFDGGATNPYLPHQHEKMSVVYTGTHDNDTTVGWYKALAEDGQQAVQEYLGYPAEAMPWPLIRSALASVATLAILPMQDLLALGSEHRMNTPGSTGDNWCWRFEWEQLPEQLAERLQGLVELYGRHNSK